MELGSSAATVRRTHMMGAQHFVNDVDQGI